MILEVVEGKRSPFYWSIKRVRNEEGVIGLDLVRVP